MIPFFIIIMNCADRMTAETQREQNVPWRRWMRFRSFIRIWNWKEARLEKCEGCAKKAAERVSTLLSEHREDIRTLVLGGEIFWKQRKRKGGGML